jgi:3',5'-cyclic AMP phosphodiesterase CpdA
MPYVLAQGNHDLKNQNGDFKDRKDSLINLYFPLASQPWIAGTFEKDRIENSYSLFNFQGTDYLVLSLEYGPRDAVLVWANQVVAKYPNHKVIMITHNYTGKNGGRSNSATGYPLPDTNAGPDMWYNLVQKHANFELVFSGHIHSDAIPINVGLGESKNWVYEMLMDYQGDPNGGNGYLCLVTFQPDGRIEVKSYSPYLGQERNQRDGYGYTNTSSLTRLTGSI